MRGAVVYGTCPRCFTDQPLRSDGCVRAHPVFEDGMAWECEGSYHAPATDHVHRCSCGVTFEETNQ